MTKQLISCPIHLKFKIMTVEQIQQIKHAIKAQKWDKASYAYAMNAMIPEVTGKIIEILSPSK